MKEIVKLALLLLLHGGILFAEDEILDVNWVKTNTFFKPITDQSNCKAVEAISFFDGHSREIESQTKINSNPGKYLISGTYVDAFRRDSISIKPYIGETQGMFKPTTNFSLISGANNYYDNSQPYRPDAKDFAYVETQYWSDGNPKEIGMPGEEYSLSKNNHVKKWSFTVNLNEYPEEEQEDFEYLDDNGFIKKDILNSANVDDYLDNKQKEGDCYFLIEAEISITDLVNPASDKQKGINLLVAGQDNTSSFEFGDIIKWDDNESKWIVQRRPKLGDLIYTKWEGSLSERTFICSAIDQNGTRTWALYSHKHHYIFNNRKVIAISRDENGVFSQILVDRYGNIIKQCTDLSDGTRLVSENEYNLNGDLVKTLPPDLLDGSSADDYKSTYTYNTLGQLLEETTPDIKTIYNYDEMGNVCFVQDSIHLYLEEKYPSIGKANIKLEYDELGRLTRKSHYFGRYKEEIVQNIYDKITVDQLKELLPDRDDLLLETIVNTLTNTRSKLLAEIANNSEGKKVVDIYSYDQKGSVITSYKFIPSIPVQKNSFVYTFSGSLKESYHYNGFIHENNTIVWKNNLTLKKTFEYNDDSNLKAVLINDKKVIEYHYSENGVMYKKSLYNTTTEDPAEEIDYTYSIRDWLKSIKTTINTDRFNELIYYNETPANSGDFSSELTPQHNSNISAVSYSGSKDGTENYSYNLSYIYDNLDRLKFAYQDNSSSQAVTPLDFDELFDYDNMGRITQKNEGDILHLVNYTYKSKTSRLEHIPNSSKATTQNGEPNYLYDPNGNTVLDRSKKMVIKYNWLDKPVLFKVYENIPEYLDDQTTPPVPFMWENLHELDSKVNKLYEVEMLYDAAGNRVQKITYEMAVAQ